MSQGMNFTTDAVVGLESTIYMVMEDVGVVEVCAIVYSPNGNILCPIAFLFDVRLSTTNGSAGNNIIYTQTNLLQRVLNVRILFLVTPMDYDAVSTVLMFAACEVRHCVNITIKDDKIPVQIESFNITLERTVGLDSRITLEPVDGVIEIIDTNSKC